MQEPRKLYLSFRWIIIIFVYYFVVFIAGVCASLAALLPEYIFENAVGIFPLAIVGSIGMASTGSALFYLRKLYKTCFLVTATDIDKNNLKRVGTIIYFMVRPIFSIGFSILVLVSLRAGFTLASKNKIEFDEGFVFVSMVLSFYVGFFSGRFINSLENSSEKMLGKVIGGGK